MKTFIITEVVPATINRTIYVEAESEEDAVHRYHEDPSNCIIEEETELDWYTSAEILEVEEAPEE